jgi:hypothetical protein
MVSEGAAIRQLETTNCTGPAIFVLAVKKMLWEKRFFN